MNFLIDSANLEEIKEAMSLGFVNGVTTNTREMAFHTTDNYTDYLKEMRKIAKGTIHVQVTTSNANQMVAEGEAINQLIDDVRIKIPVTFEGLKAMRMLSDKQIEVAATAVNTVTMAVLSAQTGAKSVISYYGGLQQFEADSIDLLVDIMEAFNEYNFDTEMIFFARDVKEVREGIRAGATGCLMLLSGLKTLIDEPFGTREVDFMLKTWRNRFGDKNWATQ